MRWNMSKKRWRTEKSMGKDGCKKGRRCVEADEKIEGR